MASDAITIYLDIHTHDPHRSEISQGNKDFGVIRKPEICTEVSGQSQRKTQRKIRSEIRFANTLLSFFVDLRVSGNFGSTAVSRLWIPYFKIIHNL